jgi:uncharacterized protein (DUF58 family)
MTRAPALTARGWLLLLAGALLSLAGALVGSWSLTAFGLALAALLGTGYLAFFPSAVLIWRRHVELSWTVRGGVDGSLFAGGAFTLEVTLRNRGPLPLGRARVRVLASSAIDPPGTTREPLEFIDDSGEPPALEAHVGARCEVALSGEGRARAAGFWFLHGAVVALGDRLGLATLEAYFPSPLALKVLPRGAARAEPPPLRAAGAGDERAGPHALRLRGLGGELRELRDHAPGDPFKQIAWKATARVGRLMVRDLDRETLVTHYLLVDLAGTMRDGPVGGTRLDQAISLASSYARAALEAGDRVGLITYDGRVHAHLGPGDGPTQRLQITERLMESLTAVDEEATDLTDGELTALVARYLRHQEAFDCRLPVPPAIDDPAWAHLATGPRGELYDLAALGKVVARVIDAERRGESPRAARARATASLPLAADPDMARLRLFCRLRGVELPIRRVSPAGARFRGLAAALEVATRGRGTQRVVLLSDLEGLDAPNGATLRPIARCVALARRRGQRLLCVAPAAQPPAETDTPTAEIFAWEQRRSSRAARRRIEALGVTVLPVGPHDTLADVVARMGGRRRMRA